MLTASLRRQNLLHKCPEYDAKLSDSEAPVLKHWGMWSISSLNLLLGPLSLRVIIPARVPSMGQITI